LLRANAVLPDTPVAENALLLLLAAFPLMGSPGPATLSLAATGSAFGLSRSLPYLAGIARC
jgi:threonine/homoserine/homoserine lactone efflux protein